MKKLLMCGQHENCVVTYQVEELKDVEQCPMCKLENVVQEVHRIVEKATKVTKAVFPHE